MIDAGYCTTMAQYNQWMNQRLYAVCEAMTDEERKHNREAFFGSIHRTLNHILYGDIAFMSRFTGRPEVIPELGEDIHDDFKELKAARAAMDNRIATWATTLTPAWLEESLTYQSKVDGLTRTMPRWVVVTHMFNHETHHRGQVTTLLSQMGLDMGSTDIPFMPGFEA